MSEMFRTFICIELPEALKARLEALESELGPQSRGVVRWVKAGNIHITLRFLGDVEASRQAELRAGVERATAGVAPFSIAAGGTGVFPNPRNPRVFWIGIKNATKHLIPLQKRIEAELQSASFGKEDKPFSPHLTIGRARQGNARPVAEAIARIGFNDEPFLVEEIIVMRSELKPTGPIYTRLATLKLHG